MRTSGLACASLVVVIASAVAACAKTDEVVPPLDDAGREMIDERRLGAIGADAIVSLLFERGPARGKTVADVGCGPGGFEPRLARAIGGRGALVLTDVRSDYLVHARARAIEVVPNVRTVVPRAGHVDLDPRSVDAVLIVMVDHLFGRHREAILLEAFDALRPGGRMLVAGTWRNQLPQEIADALTRRGARVMRTRARPSPLDIVTADR